MSNKWAKAHPLRIIWLGIKRRCLSPNSKAYKYYGGRGISICDRWLVFENFVEDVGPRPSLKHSIDRIDNDKGYYKENCRWVTQKEQSRNRRNNVKIDNRPIWEVAENCGIKITRLRKAVDRGCSLEDIEQRDIAVKRYDQMKKAAAALGLAVSTIHQRLKSGWTWEEATTTPRVKIDVSDEGKARCKRINEAADRLGMTRGAIRARLNKGWSEEDAFNTPQCF